jgi:hypothetical protein
MSIHKLLLALALTAAAGGAHASCADVKAKIEAKVAAKGVKNYVLDVVPANASAGGKVVGHCEGGSKHIVRVHGAAQSKAQAKAANPAASSAPRAEAPAKTPSPQAASASPKPPAPAKPQAPRKLTPPPALGNY